MPNKDKTGPLGQGPMTGRGLGLCGGGAGAGFRRGFGRGFGRFCPRWGAAGFAGTSPVALTKAQEKKVLEAELAEIEAEKSEIEKELKELKS